jgi:Flp pilus assembly protein TadG
MTVRTRRRELGQILAISALLLPVLLAMAGMAIDVGTYAANRRSLQNAADGAALAAGQALPDSSAATAKAYEYTADHGIDPGDVTVTVSGGTTTPTVRVSISRDHDFTFMAVVGIGSRSVGAAASAGKFSYGGGAGVVPWTVTDDMVNSSESGDEVTIKYDSGSNPGGGHFGAMRIDGNGASDYEQSAKYGASSTICAADMANCDQGDCPGTFPSSCAENSGECDGYACDPKPGNMTGPTRDAVDFRMDYTSADCDTFEEAFSERSAFMDGFDQGSDQALVQAYSTGGKLAAPDPHHGGGSHPTFTPTRTPTRTNTPTATLTLAPTNTAAPTNTPAPTNTSAASSTPAATNTAGPTVTPGPTSTPASGETSYGINPDCNPWTGGACTSATDVCSRRIFLIPVIDEYSSPYEIQFFALMYLEGYEGSCTGNSCDIKARFIKTNATLDGIFTGTYNDNGYNHFVKLIE